MSSVRVWNEDIPLFLAPHMSSPDGARQAVWEDQAAVDIHEGVQGRRGCAGDWTNVMEHDRPPGRTRRRSSRPTRLRWCGRRSDGRPGGRDLGIGETNRGNWVRQARIDRGEKPGWATEERAEMGWQRRCSDPKPSSASCGIEVYVSGWPGWCSHRVWLRRCPIAVSRGSKLLPRGWQLAPPGNRSLSRQASSCHQPCHISPRVNLS